MAIATYASRIPNANEFFKSNCAFAAQYISDGFQLLSKINLFFMSARNKKKNNKQNQKTFQKCKKIEEKHCALQSAAAFSIIIEGSSKNKKIYWMCSAYLR